MKNILFAQVLILFFQESAFSQFQYISPKPNSINHNPECSIILREGHFINPFSLKKENLFEIKGSKSGAHAFEIILSDDRKTIILKPSVSLTEGELVTVNVNNGIEKVNGESVNEMEFSFQIHPARSEEEKARFVDYHKKIWREEFGQSESSQNFSDGPTDDLPPFTIGINTNPAPGNIFYHNISLFGLPTEGPAIITSDGEFVFNKAASYKGLNFTINKNGYVTMFNELTNSFEMLDSSYYVMKHFKAGNGYETDIHDFQVFPDGHSLLLGLDYQTVDMTVYDPSYQSNATVIGAILQELDSSQHVIFEWRSWDYLNVTEALHEPLWFGFIDYVHANSIDLDADGNILLSCRNLDQVIKIDRSTGEMIWRLGGIQNEFTFINDSLHFNYQHDVRRINNGNITLFDNGNYHPVQMSHAKEYQLDEVNKTATLVWSYAHPLINGLPVIGYAMGNAQRLPNGNTLINWGSIYVGTLGHGSPNITEVDVNDSIVWEMTLDDTYNNVTYRAHRFEWDPCARPSAKPLFASFISAHKAQLNWQPATGAKEYLVQYMPLAATAWISVHAKNTGYRLTGLHPSTVYVWRVQSSCDDAADPKSAFSEVKQFTTLPAKEGIETEEEYSVAVFPNPAHESFLIQVQGFDPGQLNVSILDMMGKEISHEIFDMTGETVTVPINNIRSGWYVVKAEINEQMFIRKLFIL